MDKRILGIDFSDYRTILSYYADERIWYFPSAICKDKTTSSWIVGSSAYERVLSGEGVITDKLETFILKDKNTTIYGINYSAIELLSKYFTEIVFSTISFDETLPDRVVVSIPHINGKIVSDIKLCLINVGFAEENINIISRAEAFLYYTMSQSQDLHNNNVGMFSLEDNNLTYYELKTQRKGKSSIVFADYKLMDESFNLDLLNNDAGRKLADKILTNTAETLFKSKIFSCVIITGTGFDKQDWAPDFMKFICNKRKVFADEEVFSRGAGYRGADLANEKPLFNFTAICDGRTESSIYISINKKDRVISYPIINSGDEWYATDRTINIIPFGTKTIDLTVLPMDERKRKNIQIPLDFLPARPPKTSKISLRIHFNDANSIVIDLVDKGFGELFEASGNTVSKEVSLWD